MEATEVERQLLKSYQKSRMDCEAKAVNAIKKNPKYFFSYARKFSSVKIGIGPFGDAANELVTNSLRMAGMLSEQYKSVHCTPKESLPEAKAIFQGDQASSHWLHNVTFDLSIYIPWPFPPVWGVADNTKETNKNNGGFTPFFQQ